MCVCARSLFVAVFAGPRLQHWSDASGPEGHEGAGLEGGVGEGC